MTKAFEEDIETPPTRNIPSPGHLDPDTRIPVINLEDGTRLVGEEAPKNKDLVEWLKLHPTYTVDMPSYVPVSITEQRLVGEDSCPVSPFLSPIQHGNPWSLSLSCQCEFSSFHHSVFYIRDFPGGPSGKESACQLRRHGFNPLHCWDDPLEKGMAPHSSILAWEIPWTEEPIWSHSMRSQKSQTQPSD